MRRTASCRPSDQPAYLAVSPSLAWLSSSVLSTGGLGNTEFATAKHQRPQEHTLGEEGEVHLLEMEMKTIADVGLVRGVGEPF